MMNGDYLREMTTPADSQYLGDWRTMRRFKTRAADRIFIQRHKALFAEVSKDPDLVQRQVIRQALAFGIQRRSIAEILHVSEWVVQDIAYGGRRSLSEVERAVSVIKGLEGQLEAWKARKRAAEARAEMYGHKTKAVLVA